MQKEKRDNSWNYKGAKYLDREETNHIAVGFYPEDISAYDFGRKMIGKGWFNTGYHYIVHPDMSIEEGIPLNQYGDTTIKGWEDSICILAVGVSPEDGDKWKQFVLPWVRQKLNLDLPLKE